LVFGPNGNLFVSSQGTRTPSDSFVQEYNGTTGALEKTFVPSGSGGLMLPFGLVFGPNGNLFVVSIGPSIPATSSSVLEYNGTTGAFEKTFVPSGSGGLTEGTYLVFHSVPATGAPEPATLGLMVLGLLGAGFAGRKRRS
jgi:hypothetical protein